MGTFIPRLFALKLTKCDREFAFFRKEYFDLIKKNDSTNFDKEFQT